MNTELRNERIHPIDIHIGQRIEKRRTELGIRLDDLAVTANVSIGEINRIEQGITKATPYNLFNISHALNVTVNFFFEKYEDNFNKEIIRLVRAFLNIDNAAKRVEYIKLIEENK